MTLLTQPNELTTTQPISCMIYGQPGTGKTTLALSSDKPVLIDLDKGLHRVETRFRCPSLQVDNYKQILELLQSDEIKPFNTIVIDTLGKLIDRMGDYVALNNPKYKQADGTLAMKGWGAVKIQFQNLVKQIFNMNKSVIFVAHEKEDKDGDTRFVRPDVAGSSGKDIIKELDLMGYVEMRGNKRTVSFTPSEKFYAKNSLGLEPVIEIPDTINGNTFFVEKIVNAVEEKRKADAETLELYNSLKEMIDSKISAITDIQSLNDTYAELKEMQVIWDSKIYWKHQLADASKKVNANFNKSTGLFE